MTIILTSGKSQVKNMNIDIKKLSDAQLHIKSDLQFNIYTRSKEKSSSLNWRVCQRGGTSASGSEYIINDYEKFELGIGPKNLETSSFIEFSKMLGELDNITYFKLSLSGTGNYFSGDEFEVLGELKNTAYWQE